MRLHRAAPPSFDVAIDEAPSTPAPKESLRRFSSDVVVAEAVHATPAPQEPTAPDLLDSHVNLLLLAVKESLVGRLMLVKER